MLQCRKTNCTLGIRLSGLTGKRDRSCVKKTSLQLIILFISSTAVPAKDWSINQVADFVGKIPGCRDAAEVLRREEIDGFVFLQLQRKDLLEFGLKAGPAFKICLAIVELAEQ